ncbi:MAG: DUF4363 family protein [Clostridia bacterium]|nr:DUF4363 family protein [Clostridia bacterium]
MKIFVLAVITLCIALLLMVFISSYISSTIDTVSEAVKALPSEFSQSSKASETVLECLDSTIKYWQSRRFKLCLVTSREGFEEIESLLLNLRASVQSGDFGIYLSTLENLKEKLVRLKKSESLSPEGFL